IREGFIATRIAKRFRFVHRARRNLDVKIEQKQEQTHEKKKRAAVNPVAREARNGIQHIMRNFFDARRVRARNVEGTRGRKPRKAAVKEGNLILYPEQKIVTVAPYHSGAKQKQQITAERKQPERRAGAPTHKGPPVAGATNSKTRGRKRRLLAKTSKILRTWLFGAASLLRLLAVVNRQ